MIARMTEVVNPRPGPASSLTRLDGTLMICPAVAYPSLRKGDWMEPATTLLNVLDYEARASEIIPSALFNRWFGTYRAPDWITNTNNLDAFQATKLRPRVLAGIGTSGSTFLY